LHEHKENVQAGSLGRVLIEVEPEVQREQVFVYGSESGDTAEMY
jgi:hypothetical protein